MDPTRFDTYTRLVGSSTTRRATLAGLLGLAGHVLSSTTSAAPLEDTVCLRLGKRCGDRRFHCCGTAKCRHGRCQCSGRQQVCHGRCIARSRCCDGCGAGEICVTGTCVPRRCGRGAPCRVFVTSAAYPGDLRQDGQGSGIAGADAKCQALADASPLTSGGTFLAWLSGSTLASSPARRFTNTARTGPYVLPDADTTVIAADWAELTSGTLRAPITVTESGDLLDTSVWTHTLANGTPGGPQDQHCQAWTSAAAADGGDVGDNEFADAQWTGFTTFGCDSGGIRLYCFEQG